MKHDTPVRKSAEQVSCDLGGEAAILNLRTGVYYGLDPIGARIWALLANPITVIALRDAITAEYDVTPEACEADIRDLLRRFAAAGLVITVMEEDRGEGISYSNPPQNPKPDAQSRTP